MNLSYMELLGDVNMINKELDNYVLLTADNLKEWSETYLAKEKVCKIYYKATQNG